MTATDAGDWIKSLQMVPFSIGALLILIWLFHVFITHGLSRLLEPIYFWRNRRRELLDSYLAMQSKGGELDDVALVIADMRDAIYFYEATGIQAERKWRLELIKLHEETSPNISWRTIKLASRYLAPDGMGRVKLVHSFWRESLLTGFLIVIVFNLIMMLFYCVLELPSVTLKGAHDYVNVFGIVVMIILHGYIIFATLLPYVALQKITSESYFFKMLGLRG